MSFQITLFQEFASLPLLSTQNREEALSLLRALGWGCEKRGSPFPLPWACRGPIITLHEALNRSLNTTKSALGNKVLNLQRSNCHPTILQAPVVPQETIMRAHLYNTFST